MTSFLLSIGRSWLPAPLARSYTSIQILEDRVQILGLGSVLEDQQLLLISGHLTFLLLCNKGISFKVYFSLFFNNLLFRNNNLFGWINITIFRTSNDYKCRIQWPCNNDSFMNKHYIIMTLKEHHYLRIDYLNGARDKLALLLQKKN